MVLGELTSGTSVDDVLAGYPYLEQADIFAALEYAAAIANAREFPITRPALSSRSMQTFHPGWSRRCPKRVIPAPMRPKSA